MPRVRINPDFGSFPPSSGRIGCICVRNNGLQTMGAMKKNQVVMARDIKTLLGSSLYDANGAQLVNP